MPRPRSGATERWVSDVPINLSERAHALRAHNAKWFTKALMLESALAYYVEVAERDGLETLPPFKLARPSGPSSSGAQHDDVEKQPQDDHHHEQSDDRTQWQTCRLGGY